MRGVAVIACLFCVDRWTHLNDNRRMTEPHDELQPEETAIVSTLERSKGRDLTEQEINPALDQARAIGDIQQARKR